MKLKKWICDYCTPGCIAHGERFPECCPYEYDPGEFCWKEDTRADEPVKKADYSYDDLVGMLEDVVNELDLSESMLEKHGPMGSPPAQMVREVLDKKDLHIRMLKQGFVDVGDKSKSEPVSVEDSALCQNCKTIGRNGEHSWYCRKCGEKL